MSGTPKPDPVIQQWMIDIGKRLAETGTLEHLATLPDDLTVWLIADIVARHAPDPNVVEFRIQDLPRRKPNIGGEA